MEEGLDENHRKEVASHDSSKEKLIWFCEKTLKTQWRARQRPAFPRSANILNVWKHSVERARAVFKSLLAGAAWAVPGPQKEAVLGMPISSQGTSRSQCMQMKNKQTWRWDGEREGWEEGLRTDRTANPPIRWILPCSHFQTLQGWLSLHLTC